MSIPPSATTITYAHRVGFHETDAMGIVHHSNYLKFCEDARVVWLETELDRFALTGEVDPQWKGVLSALEPSAPEPLSALERASLSRAADYGLLDAGQRERWADVVERARSETPRSLPLDPVWLERLAACLPPGTAPGPELRAWLDWRAATEPSR